MTENSTIRTKSVEVAMLKGEINAVTVNVYSGFAEGNHKFTFCLSTVNRGESTIKRNGHSHPWGDSLIHDVERYADDAKAARQEAWDELERRNLDNPDGWHDSSV